MPRSSRLAAALLGAAFLACAPDNGSDGTTAQPDTQPPPGSTADASRAPAPDGIPPGGLEDWIADIRSGLAALPDRIPNDHSTARTEALALYVGRQESIEIYYGENGRLTAGEELGPAVEHAEEKFHELLVMLNGQEPPDAANVRATIAAIEAAYDRVLEEARLAGVPLTPDATAAPAGS